MAPQADIIAIQVFSRFTSTYVCGSGQAPCVRTFEHDQLAALAYVADLADSYNIASVNMSLGGGRYYGACDSSKPSFVPVVDALHSLDIVVAASSGNNYWDDSIGHPACLSKIVSVGSVFDNSDTVSAFSNGASFLDVLAPGQGITAAYPGSRYATASGTSMAAPHVAGALALLKGYDGSLSHAEMKSLLLGNGTPVLDTRNNLTFPRLDLGLLTLAVAGGLAGDADHDGDVDIADLILVQQHSTGVNTLGTDAIRRCDLHPTGSPDGQLNASDLVLLEQLLIAL
jgi:subtilisin family serine protease